MPSISGEFTVTMSPQPAEERAGSPGRMLLDKTYLGALAGASVGQMLAVHGGVSGSAAYVAIETVTATLDGRAGSFALVHRGVMDRGQPSLEIQVVPDSGTGELAGLSGRMGIRIEAGKHFYDFDYQLA